MNSVRLVRLLTCLAAVSVPAVAAQTEQGWTDAGSRDGVTLTFRDNPTLDAREVRAVAELPHASQRIVPIVCDFTQVLDPGMREARILSGGLGARYEIYLRYAPRYWIVAARDVVIDVRESANGCSWSEVNERVPPPSGTVRMPLLRGAWTVEPIDSSRSRVTYQIAVRPGGRIPAWLVRRGALSALPDVINRVSRCLSSPEGRTGRCQKPQN